VLPNTLASEEKNKILLLMRRDMRQNTSEIQRNLLFSTGRPWRDSEKSTFLYWTPLELMSNMNDCFCNMNNCLFLASSFQVRLDRTCASGFLVIPPVCLDSLDCPGEMGSAGFYTAVPGAVDEALLWAQLALSLETWTWCHLRQLSGGSHWTKSLETSL